MRLRLNRDSRATFVSRIDILDRRRLRHLFAQTYPGRFKATHLQNGTLHGHGVIQIQLQIGLRLESEGSLRQVFLLPVLIAVDPSFFFLNL